MCAVPLAAEDADLALVDGAFKLLTSADSIVQDAALQDLTETVSHRLGVDVTDADLSEYLSACNDPRFRRSSNRVSSTWTLARAASGRLGVKWLFASSGAISISHPGGTVAAHQRRQVCRRLRLHRRQARAEQLISLPDQGKAMECVAASRASTHFLREGSFTRFADWRFIHKARLNLVSLNGRRRWGFRGNPNCRRCGKHLETLPHVINHCNSLLHLVKRRHDAIVDRVKKAAERRFSVLREDQQFLIPALRPDLILTSGDSAIIVDVTIPFDNRLQAFADAREAKVQKYRPVAEALSAQYSDVRIEALIVGSLGSWDTANEPLLKRLCSRKYASLFRKLCVSDTVRWSRDIYVEFVSGQRQAPAPGHAPVAIDGTSCPAVPHVSTALIPDVLHDQTDASPAAIIPSDSTPVKVVAPPPPSMTWPAPLPPRARPIRQVAYPGFCHLEHINRTPIDACDGALSTLPPSRRDKMPAASCLPLPPADTPTAELLPNSLDAVTSEPVDSVRGSPVPIIPHECLAPETTAWCPTAVPSGDPHIIITDDFSVHNAHLDCSSPAMDISSHDFYHKTIRPFAGPARSAGTRRSNVVVDDVGGITAEA